MICRPFCCCFVVIIVTMTFCMFLLGVSDTERVVRNSALFALGQFAEHLQPDISEFHGNLVPVLIQFMDNAIVAMETRPQEKTGMTKIFYALETFCENLGSELLIYLPTLMDKLFFAVTSTNVCMCVCACVLAGRRGINHCIVLA